MRTQSSQNDTRPAAVSQRLPETNPSRTAGCEAMQVAYASGFGEAGFAPLPDRIQVVIPDGEAALQASYTPADGRPRRAVVRSPSLAVVPANQPHRLWSEVPCKVVVISLSSAFYAQRSRSAFGVERPLVENYAADDRFLRGIGNALSGAFASGQDPSSRYLEALAATVAIHLATHYHSEAVANPTAAAGLAAHKLQRVLALIDQRLAEPIQVKELADSIHMSPFHFARMFKLATGLPPHAYITQQRMERAKALLGFTDMALVDVATHVGYQTQAHFTGVFHRQVGMTPRVYRRSCRSDPAAYPAGVSVPLVRGHSPQPVREAQAEAGE